MNRILVGAAVLSLAGVYAASADVVVMDDGRRINGELISVNRGTVLFDEIQEGTTRKHRLRLNKDEVARIVLRESTLGDDEDQAEIDDGPFGPSRDRGADDRYPRDDSYPRPESYPRDDRSPRDRDPDAADDPVVTGRDRMISVSAQKPWTDTGIDVKAGDVVRFSAEGTVRWGAGQEDGPAGEMNSPINDRRPVPARPAGALIGRIGTSPSDVFFIGDDRGSFRVRTSGQLYLGVNDHAHADNSGSFEVRISR